MRRMRRGGKFAGVAIATAVPQNALRRCTATNLSWFGLIVLHPTVGYFMPRRFRAYEDVVRLRMTRIPIDSPHRQIEILGITIDTGENVRSTVATKYTMMAGR